MYKMACAAPCKERSKPRYKNKGNDPSNDGNGIFTIFFPTRMLISVKVSVKDLDAGNSPFNC